MVIRNILLLIKSIGVRHRKGRALSRLHLASQLDVKERRHRPKIFAERGERQVMALGELKVGSGDERRMRRCRRDRRR